MYNITIRFHGDLNFFLPPKSRDKNIPFSFAGRRSVKDLIESIGVPHVEVGHVMINDESEKFSYIVKDGDIINVYPFRGSVYKADPDNAVLPPDEIRFVLDVHLQKLAGKMRLMGFDTDFGDDRDDALLAEISRRENRILLTCDRQLLMRKIVSHGAIVRSRDPALQIIEVIERFNLQNMIRPFTRCIACNGIIERAAADDDLKRSVPDGVISWCSDFFRCNSCNKVYWKGSHYDRLSAEAERITGRVRGISTDRQ